MPCHSVTRDANVDIVKATVERSRHCTTTLVGEATYLLLHYSKTDNEIIYCRSDANKQSKEHRVYTINLLKETLGDDVCNEFLFVHAYSGCDSTSRIYGIRKKSSFKTNLKRTYQIFAKTWWLISLVARYAIITAPYHIHQESGNCSSICHSWTTSPNITCNKIP